MRTRLLGLAVACCSLLPSLPAQADDLDGYIKAIQDQPNDPKAYENYAIAAFAKGRTDDAIAQLKMGVARVPDFPRGYYLLASSYRKKSAWVDAATFYRCYIVLRPNETDSYWGLGKALIGIGDKQGAIQVFKKYVSLENSPQRKKYIDDAKAELAKLEPTSAAAPIVVASTVATPTVSVTAVPVPMAASAPVAAPSAEAVKLRGEAERLKNEKKYEESATAYQQAIAADPNNLELYSGFGSVCFILKRYGDAVQAFKDAVMRKPDFADGWYNMAFALKKAARYTEAVDAYRRYLTMKPSDADAYYGLGGSLKQTGDLAGAALAFNKYISIEQRPEQQKFVEKARKELAEIQERTAPPTQ